MGTELGDSFSDVACAEDVATYGALCALAELDRGELKKHLAAGGSGAVPHSFQDFLGLVPQMREVVEDVCGSRYGAALRGLEAMRGSLLLDLFLSDHAEALFQSVRDKCMCEYFLPYVSVSLEAMAGSFATPLPEMEAAVARLIMDGRISARIDSEAKTLSVKTEDSRDEAMQKVEMFAERYLVDVKGMLLRMSCIENNFVVKSAQPRNNQLGGYVGSQGMYDGNQQEAGADMGDL